MSYIAGSEGTSKRKAFALSAAFILGIAFINAALGTLFSAGGAVAGELFGPKWNLIAALMLLVMGLRILGIVRFKAPMPQLKGREVSGIISAFLFGIPFAFSLCPYCIPIQLALLTVAASIGNIWYGTVLLFTFGLARGAPLLLAGIFTGALKSLKPLVGYVAYFEKIAGIAFVILSAYYLHQFWKYLNI
jgi:cytochrome c-type biogenesis protein